MIRNVIFAVLLTCYSNAAGAEGPAATPNALTPDAKNPNRLCVADKTWCASIIEDKAAPGILIEDSGTTRTVDLPTLPAEGGFGGNSYHLWPMRVPFGGKGDYLIGSIMDERTMYSGGWANASNLTVHLVTPLAKAVDVLTVPWESGSAIRACFSEKDFRQRAGACHDEYDYLPDLEPMTGRAGGPPLLRYKAKATSYPGPVSRSADSLAAKRLRKKDLVHVEHADCTFTRDFTFDPASRTYVPDRPLPECGDFTGL